MEHGAVWITYRPDLAADQVETLRAAADDDFMLLSPYPGLPGNIVLSSWNRQLALTDAADPRLPWFTSGRATVMAGLRVAPQGHRGPGALNVVLDLLAT